MEMLGNFWSHAFVVFTNAAEYGDTETEQNDGLQEDLRDAPEELKWLVEQTSRRYVLVESITARTTDRKNSEKYLLPSKLPMPARTTSYTAMNYSNMLR